MNLSKSDQEFQIVKKLSLDCDNVTEKEDRDET